MAFYDDALLVDAAHHIHPILDGILARKSLSTGFQVRFQAHCVGPPNGLHARFIDQPLARKRRRVPPSRLRTAWASRCVRRNSAEKRFRPIPGTVEWGKAVAAGCIPADADPLLHSNSVYPCADPQVWEELKQQIRKGNCALLA